MLPDRSMGFRFLRILLSWMIALALLSGPGMTSAFAAESKGKNKPHVAAKKSGAKKKHPKKKHPKHKHHRHHHRHHRHHHHRHHPWHWHHRTIWWIH